MQFQVFIPSPDLDGFDITLMVEAENWMEALKLGLRRTHSEDSPIQNVFCDIKPNNLVHVTDQSTRRMFRIRQLEERERVPDEPIEPPEPVLDDNLPTQPDGFAIPPANGAGRFRHPKEFPAATPPATTPMPGVRREAKSQAQIPTEPGTYSVEPFSQPVAAPSSAPPDKPITQEVTPDTKTEIPTLKTGQPLSVKSQSGRFRVISTREVRAQAVGDPTQPRLLQESVVPTSERLRALSFDDEPYEEPSLTGSAIEDVFLEIPELFEGEKSLEDAIAFSIDLAMQHVCAESGSVLFLNETGTALNFAAARGPKADELIARDFTVPIAKGIAGFCVREGISLAVSDVAQDPRFYREIADELGYPSESILCAPIQCEGHSFGAIELVNHCDRDLFNSAELNILTYIANQTGRFIQNRLAS